MKNARKLPEISYDEMLEMASLGAKVLQTRSVGLAMKYSMKVRVLSTFDENHNNNFTLLVKFDTFRLSFLFVNFDLILIGSFHAV